MSKRGYTWAILGIIRKNLQSEMTMGILLLIVFAETYLVPAGEDRAGFYRRSGVVGCDDLYISW